MGIRRECASWGGYPLDVPATGRLVSALWDSGAGENLGTDRKKHWVIFSTGRAPDKKSCVLKPDVLLGKIHRSISESAPGLSEDNAPDFLQ